MAYVYVIYDRVTRKRYIGRHNGSNPDYWGSGKIITSVREKRPEALRKRIVFESDDLDLVLQKEREYQQTRYDRGTWDQYYNIIIGDPSEGADMAGDRNPNYKHGGLVGAKHDPAIRARVDKTRNSERHSKHGEGSRHRMLARYHLQKGNLDRARQEFDLWQQYKRSMPASDKGNYVRKYENWEEWKDSQVFR